MYILLVNERFLNKKPQKSICDTDNYHTLFYYIKTGVILEDFYLCYYPALLYSVILFQVAFEVICEGAVQAIYRAQ